MDTIYFSADRRRLRRAGWLLLIAALCAVAVLVGSLIRAPDAGAVTGAGPSQRGGATTLADLETRVAAGDADGATHALLGLAYLRQVSESGDVTYYNRAAAALDEALARDQAQGTALVGQGQLALARHDFPAALRWGRQALTRPGQRAAALAILVDAHVELGRYARAVALADELGQLRPDLPAYSRIAYLRELHGDVPDAIEAMRAAVEAGDPRDVGTVWAQVELGHLYFNSGDLEAAGAAYERALALRPDYVPAVAGLARVEGARGDVASAIARLAPAVERYPAPGPAILLGNLYAAAGQSAAAARQYALVDVLQQLNQGAGMNVELELARFAVERSADPAAALAQARAVYAARPTIYAADLMSRALWRAGDVDAAWDYSVEARRLGTRDAAFYVHAATLAAARGDGAAARELRATARAIRPYPDLGHAAGR